ncbi:efflux RND transporter permease subunit [Bowmanella denitrificans]|uniref:efflux RND transporter permease subunit n=1 Tax=Bowmanella denitrificans TaxID=366582 RepID=UPI000C9CB34A|nr:efflux RND transporter permease subunit [Bowmanella denitrificans]
MKGLVRWFVANPVAANMLMLVILAFGLLSAWTMRIEGFPRIPPDTVEVSVVQIGASTQQVHQSITQSLEQALEGLPGAKQISSLSGDSLATVYIRQQDGYDLGRLLEDVKLRIDNITTLPLAAERPQVRRAEFSYPAMIVQVYGDVAQEELQKAARIIKQRLLLRPEISQINQWGERPHEISLEISHHKLQAHGLRFEQVAQMLSQASLEYRTGQLKTVGGRIQIRADHLARDVREFMQLPLFTSAEGHVVRLADVAEIRDQPEDDDLLVTFNGHPAIGFEIMMGQQDNLLDINQAVQQVVAESEDILSQRIKADIWANQSEFATQRLSLLQSNALQGLILVFLILSLFLNIKVAFWVAVGIPVSLAGTIAIMDLYFGYSLNDITTFGMIIVLGILVDDAVVIGESVHHGRQSGGDPHQATVAGVEKVATATVFGAFTTLAAFFPMTVLEDPFGKVFGSFAVVVMIALVFSLLESKLILPSHLASANFASNERENMFARGLKFLQLKAEWGLSYVTEHWYQPLLQHCLRYRATTLILFTLVLLFAFSLLSIGAIRTTFFPDIPGNIISVKLETDSRLNQQVTLQNARQILHQAEKLNQQWTNEFGLTTPPFAKLMLAVVGPSSAEIYAELSATSERPMDTMSMLDSWRDHAGQLEGAQKVVFTVAEETTGGFELEVFGPDPEGVKAAVQQVVDGLHQVPHVSDVASDLQSGNAELRLRPTQAGMNLGVDVALLAAQLGDAYGGLELQRFQRGMDEVKVYLRYPQEDRDSLSDLLHQQIQLPGGQWVPLLSVAELDAGYVPRWMWRRDFQDAATVTANIDKRHSASPEVYGQLMQGQLADWLSAHPSIKVMPAGELKREEEMADKLWRALILACLLIYVLLAIPLKSYWQPLIILSVVPFGFVGAAIGHMLMGLPFSVLSFFGMLALTGVVVNDSLLLVTSYNRYCAEGKANPLVSSATGRVRAVFLTTATTVIGLAPILLESSEQAQYLIPAAVSLAFGELFATLVTLILVPVLASFYRVAPVSTKVNEALPLPEAFERA